jgi:hypothetical protein
VCLLRNRLKLNENQFINTSSSDFSIYDDTITAMNVYQGMPLSQDSARLFYLMIVGAVYQQATSAISKTDQVRRLLTSLEISLTDS